MPTSKQISRTIHEIETLINQKLSETMGEVTEEIDSLMEQLETSQEEAGAKLDSIEQVVLAMKGNCDAIDAMAKAYADKASQIQKRANAMSDKIEYLKSLAYRLVAGMPEREYRTAQGTKLYIQSYEKLDDSELTDEDKFILVENKIGEEVVTHKVLKKDLKQAIDDYSKNPEHFPDSVKVILDRVYVKKSNQLRGL